MKRLLAALLLLAVYPTALQAQSNYKSGLVVTTAGDTLKGFINYQEWNETPTAIQYAASSDGNEQREFNPQTAQYVELTGLEVFRSYSGPVTMNELEAGKLTSDRGMRVTDAQLFLREVSKGANVSLLSHTDHIKTRFFVQENNSSRPQELYYVKYYTSDIGNKVFNMKSYVGQLLIMAGKYVAVTPAMKREIETANYAAEPLQRIVNQMNNMSHDEAAAEGKLKGKPRLFAGVALSSTRMQFSGSEAMAASEPSVSYMPRFAVGVDAFVNRNTQRLLLRVEGAFTASKHTFENQAHSSAHYYHRTYRVAQQTASLMPQVIYNVYNRDNLKVYMGGGIALNFTNYSTNDYSYTYGTEDTNYGTFELDEKKLEPFWTSWALRTGVVLNRRYEFTAIYLPNASLTKYFGYAVEQQGLSLGMNYLFNK